MVIYNSFKVMIMWGSHWSLYLEHNTEFKERKTGGYYHYDYRTSTVHGNDSSRA